MTMKEALEVLQKQYNCWTTVSLECPIQCEKCENRVGFADFLEALKTVLDAFGNCSELPNSSDLVSRSYLLAEYDRQHEGPPGGARKIIEEAPPGPTSVSQTKFKPGDKFLLEIGEKRIGLDEYSIVGTDLYVWGSLLEKLTPYEQAEQKKGRWIPVDDPSITGRCSVCGFESHLCEDDVYGYDYCPNCGARLEVVDE